jgi:hypothetical protein
MSRKAGLLSLLGIAVVVLLAFTPLTPARAANNHTTTTRFVENLDIVISASDGCSGEDVHVFGTLDVVVQTTEDGHGGNHVGFHLTPHLSAEGLSSGLEYRTAGPSEVVTFDEAGSPRVLTGINLIRLIAPGSADDLQIKETIRVIVNADGTVTVDSEGVTAACRG